MMDTLHTVLRTIRSETKSRRDHLNVFRDFVKQLNRLGRRAPRGEKQNGAKSGGKPAVRRGK
jgi:hypothetical protein